MVAKRQRRINWSLLAIDRCYHHLLCPRERKVDEYRQHLLPSSATQIVRMVTAPANREVNIQILMRRTRRMDKLYRLRVRRLAAFEDILCRNAVILCDVRGTLVEYAQENPDEPDPRNSTEMKMASNEARICVIRKKENRPHVGTVVITSI